MNKFFLLIAVLLLSACSSAKQSGQINKAYVSSAKYNSFTCEQLIQESELIRAREPALAAKVDQHYKSQKNTEAVAWLLFWPAAFWLDDGSQEANQLAQVRGELDAVRSAMMSKKCG
ncbi:hypothetical protein N9394_02240 [Candidatus Pelagibacter sp.]|jgi:hypothetical protein|nr:hypothetical protein [Candidatus Pelagibacter sp.]|tara:strand:- start:265 stop:615 length:351 start_codon:yes stop_codon:yes gene_type:complete